VTAAASGEWDPFYDLDEQFSACLKRERFKTSANRYAETIAA
jgi:hypothetical protein